LRSIEESISRRLEDAAFSLGGSIDEVESDVRAMAANPQRVMETDAYPSLTTSDVNIGTVSALVDDKGDLFGVIGIDVTLVSLTDYIVSFSISPSGETILIGKNGVVLASQDKQMRGVDLGTYSPELKETLPKADQGPVPVRLRGEGYFVFSRTLARPDWTIVALVPLRDIAAQTRAPVLMTISGLVIGPLRRFTEETDRVAETSNLDRRIEIHSNDEIGVLARSYNQMIDSHRQSQESLERKESDLRDCRDHLEELVMQRTTELQQANG
jgi:methyl-accepting chemotaxis protein